MNVAMTALFLLSIVTYLFYIVSSIIAITPLLAKTGNASSVVQLFLFVALSSLVSVGAHFVRHWFFMTRFDDSIWHKHVQNPSEVSRDGGRVLAEYTHCGYVIGLVTGISIGFYAISAEQFGFSNLDWTNVCIMHILRTLHILIVCICMFVCVCVVCEDITQRKKPAQMDFEIWIFLQLPRQFQHVFDSSRLPRMDARVSVECASIHGRAFALFKGGWSGCVSVSVTV